jgi:molecular chaperone HscB
MHAIAPSQYYLMMQSLFEKDYFDLFGMEKSFSIDCMTLRNRLRELQKKFHPDNFVQASDHEKRLSAQYAALINEAYNILNDPVKRGKYMLSLQGVSTDEEHDTQMDPEFLMQQMELRERLESAKSSDGDPFESLNRLSHEVDNEFADREGRLAGLLEKAERSDSEEKNKCLDMARQLVRELQFLNRIQSEIEDAEEALI